MAYKIKSYRKTLKFNGKIYKLDTKPLLTGFGQSRSANAKKRKTELNKSGYNVRIVKRKTIDGTNRILVYKRKKHKVAPIMKSIFNLGKRKK